MQVESRGQPQAECLPVNKDFKQGQPQIVFLLAIWDNFNIHFESSFQLCAWKPRQAFPFTGNPCLPPLPFTGRYGKARMVLIWRFLIGLPPEAGTDRVAFDEGMESRGRKQYTSTNSYIWNFFPAHFGSKGMVTNAKTFGRFHNVQQRFQFHKKSPFYA
jgi:hypothetical protein